MSVAIRKSGVITNRDATPRVTNNAAVARGALRSFSGTLETVSGDNIGSTYIFGSVPSNAVMKNLRLYCDDIGTTTIADFGLYQTTENGGAVVSAALFGSAVSLKDGALNGTDIMHESGTYDIALVEQPLWQVLSLSSDPCIEYDVVATLTAAADAAATVSLQGVFSV